MPVSRIPARPTVKNTNEELLKQVYFLDGPYKPKVPAVLKFAIGLGLLGISCLFLAAIVSQDWVSLAIYLALAFPSALAFRSFWASWKRNNGMSLS